MCIYNDYDNKSYKYIYILDYYTDKFMKYNLINGK